MENRFNNLKQRAKLRNNYKKNKRWYESWFTLYFFGFGSKYEFVVMVSLSFFKYEFFNTKDLGFVAGRQRAKLQRYKDSPEGSGGG